LERRVWRRRQGTKGMGVGVGVGVRGGDVVWVGVGIGGWEYVGGRR
jgi:hypothetical protein